VLIELHDRSTLAVYPDVAAAVDALLRDELPSPELRTLDVDGQVWMAPPAAPIARAGRRRGSSRGKGSPGHAATPGATRTAC
jgi:hypothetical protein